MVRTSLKWGIYDKKIAFSSSLGPSHIIKLIGNLVVRPRSMTELDQEVFPGTDDGLNIQREMLVRYRAAVAVAETLNTRSSRRMADGFEARTERKERELEGCMDNLTIADRQAVGRGVRGEEYDG